MKKSLPKLTLNKETLRDLSSKEPALVRGRGEIDTIPQTCPSVCPACLND